MLYSVYYAAAQKIVNNCNAVYSNTTGTNDLRMKNYKTLCTKKKIKFA